MSSVRLKALLLLVGGVLVAVLAALDFLEMRRDDLIVPGPGVKERFWLSRYLENLKGSPGDTDIFFLEGSAAGGSFLLLGGTHPQETAGVLAAILLIERALASKGRFFVIPQANASGFTHSDPMEGYPRFFEIPTRDGARRFRLGMRRANPLHYWPDPEVYVHHPSGERLAGDEIRNLNRGYPGKAQGSLMERVAFAVAELIRREKVDVVLDLHEAYPEYSVVNVLVAHERAMDLASGAILDLQAQGMRINLMPSPKNLHGLSHRELGDFTPALALLAETPSPNMGRLRGKTSAELVVKGRDPFYVFAGQRKRLFVPFTEEGWPLSVRVGRHLDTLNAVLAAWNELTPARPLELKGLPGLSDLKEKGLGGYLRAPSDGASGKR